MSYTKVSSQWKRNLTCGSFHRGNFLFNSLKSLQLSTSIFHFNIHPKRMQIHVKTEQSDFKKPCFGCLSLKQSLQDNRSWQSLSEANTRHSESSKSFVITFTCDTFAQMKFRSPTWQTIGGRETCVPAFAPCENVRLGFWGRMRRSMWVELRWRKSLSAVLPLPCVNAGVRVTNLPYD